MNAREMVARLNDLDEQLCGAFRVPRSGDAATLDEAITMAAAATDPLLAGERSIREYTLSPIGPSSLAAFLRRRSKRAR